MNFIKLKKKKDRFEFYLFGHKIVFYRYLRILREIFLMIHYNQLKETLKTKFNITLPKEAYHHLSGNVEIVKLALKDLHVPCGHRKTCPIDETQTYKYLKNKSANYTYRNKDFYCEADVFLPVDESDTAKRMLELVKSLTQKDEYDPSKCVIVVRKNNAIIDGQHRAAVLYHKYGPNHKVLVVRER